MTSFKSLVLICAVQLILWADGWTRVGRNKWRKTSPNKTVTLIGDWRYALSQFINLQKPSK